MLKIDINQICSLEEISRAQFEAKLVAHLRENEPATAGKHGDDLLLAFVRHAWERAHRYGFSSELAVSRYLRAAVTFGARFDESPDYPWARHLLNSDVPPSEKMDRLLDAMDYELEARRINGARRR